MKRAVFVLAALLLIQPVKAASLSAAEALEIKQRAGAGGFAARAEWMALTFYLQGAVETAMGYNEVLKAAGKKPLFCPPPNSSESLDGLLAVLERAKAEDRSKEAAALILEDYARRYPC
ncbi:hypothetical protein [Hyphococcus sp.]|uniref:hypothetical protein n=1 Tax=Hyphococcus sp. TaxID=2038636 RepID=UPI003D10A613